MKTLTLLQFISIFLAYLSVTAALPAVILRNRLKGLSLSVRFLVWYMTGNFCVINLVFVLQIPKISNHWTLLLSTAALAAAAEIRMNHRHPLAALRDILCDLRKLLEGKLGLRSYLTRLWESFWVQARKALRAMVRSIRRHFMDYLLTAVLIALVLWIYGQNLLENYGYCASDIPVHNYWINYMSRKQLFVNGVYPFGFHCVIYYLHALFGFETYVLLRVFWLVQTLMIHIVLLTFLKGICKSRYVPYIGTVSFMLNIYGVATYSRYFSSLPQEFGMIFILPPIYFVFAFFEAKKKELEKEPQKRKKREKREKSAKKSLKERLADLRGFRPRWSDYCLLLFAISFSMTLAVHFYGTMISGIFCIGIAIGYFFRLFRKEYFGRVMGYGILSIVLAVLPMATAFAMGTPLQGSLGWGMSIISGENDESVAESSQGESATFSQTEKQPEQFQTTQESAESVKEEFNPPEVNIEQPPADNRSLTEKLELVVQTIKSTLSDFVLSEGYKDWNVMFFYGIFLLFAMGVLMLVFDRDYAGILFSTAWFIALMLILLASGRLGFPELMLPGRSNIYLVYVFALVFALGVDSVLYLLLGKLPFRRPLQVASFLCMAAVGLLLYQMDLIREPKVVAALETNDAVTCLTNIIREHEDFTWTIVSANDELRMAEDYGWHYETSDFLRKMEYVGSMGNVKIPTEHVYIFIEKIPLDYTVRYEGSGQSVSVEGAKKELPWGSGLGIYQGENRWITMSRMYYWAQKYQEMFPNELQTYYETDEFVCYYVRQNPYRVYNFAIDYDYNMKPVEETEG